MDRRAQLNLAYALIALLAILAIERWWSETQRVEPISYSEFLALVDEGKIKDAYVNDQFIHGAADDLNRATDIARNMVTRFGMHDKLGQVTYEMPRQTFLGEDALAHYAEREFSEETAREIDCAVRELIDGAYESALAVLRQNRKALQEGARLLLEKETLTREELPPLAEIRLAAASEFVL